MVHTSGFGWNATTNMVDVESDQVWNEYVKAHKEVENYRYKSFPYFPVWCEVFGRDRANGDGATGYTEAENNMNDVHFGSEEETECTAPVSNAPPVGTAPINGAPPYNAAPSSTTRSVDPQISNNVPTGCKKRKTMESIVAPVVGVMNEFVKNSDALLAQIAGKMETPATLFEEKSKLIVKAVDEIPGIQEMEAIYATHKILGSPSNVEMFLNWGPECRISFVKLLIQGKIM